MEQNFFFIRQRIRIRPFAVLFRKNSKTLEIRILHYFRSILSIRVLRTCKCLDDFFSMNVIFTQSSAYFLINHIHALFFLTFYSTLFTLKLQLYWRFKKAGITLGCVRVV